MEEKNQNEIPWDGIDRRQPEIFKVSTWVIPIIISLLITSGSYLVAFGGFKENVANLDKRITALEFDNEKHKERIVALDTMVPVLQRDIADIKSDVKEVKEDIKKVLIAVKQ